MQSFDSVEYDILLYHLYNNGVNGRIIISCWYTNPTCSVHLNQRTSRKYYSVYRSEAVSSPVLFNICLTNYQSLNKKPTDLKFSVGCVAHADDI